MKKKERKKLYTKATIWKRGKILSYYLGKKILQKKKKLKKWNNKRERININKTMLFKHKFKKKIILAYKAKKNESHASLQPSFKN